MELLVDIGNTNAVLGLSSSDGSGIAKSFRVSTQTERTIDELSMLLKSFLGELPKGIERVVLCSVVPRLTGDYEKVFTSLGFETLHVESANSIFVDLLRLSETIPVPALLGADRLANGMAALSLFGPKSLVVDLGTATTFDVIDSEGRFRAGPIAIGPRLSLHALSERAARLPFIELEWPETVLGDTTMHAMQSGVVRGYSHLIDGLVFDLETELGFDLEHVVATGGLGDMFAKRCKRVRQHIPDLTLQGLIECSRVLREK